MEITRQECQAFLVDSNEALDLKLVRNREDLQDDSTSFKPELSHQVFGENENIFGYRDLKIKLYYTAARLIPYLGLEFKEKADAEDFEGVKADDVLSILAEKMQPGFHDNLDSFISALDEESEFLPFGEMLYSFKAGLDGESNRTFSIYHCDTSNQEFIKFHERLQTFLLWFVDASSFIDTDDDNWRFFVCYEEYKKDGKPMYAVAGYATVYQYYAYPKHIRPRISQMLVLPPFQRMGIGAKLLQTIYQHYIGDGNVLDITVEDPSADFQRLRDFVDCQNLMKLPSFQPDQLKKGFSETMSDEARISCKINKKQARRVYEILRLKATNRKDKEEYRQYRLAIKRRLNTPFQKEQLLLQKLQKVLTEDELKASAHLKSQEQRLENLDRQFQELEADYQKVLERLAHS